jgi:hypothetical protein
MDDRLCRRDVAAMNGDDRNEHVVDVVNELANHKRHSVCEDMMMDNGNFQK